MSGGYNKYRCKYWLTHDCPNWVFMNKHACGACLAEGREGGEGLPGQSEIQIPQALGGNLEYTIMGLLPAEPGTYYTYLQKAVAPRIPTSNVVTSDTPRPVVATTGIQTGVIKAGVIQMQGAGEAPWPVMPPNMIQLQTRW
ncbi:hypothetical protein QBC42DRAFT_191181 [Cladorrhinum samala]|uniref:Uncharacterized protein n=1 Tax=Cladorrhinum samala TaxID=585594 RepID=A0AAV9H7G4_9PEZI|nr:hypothetical protein QBC42DRAFT_191181 [Cladorrhinum samala]